MKMNILKIIINSKVSEETIIKAKEILNKETSNVLNLSNEHTIFENHNNFKNMQPCTSSCIQG